MTAEEIFSRLNSITDIARALGYEDAAAELDMRIPRSQTGSKFSAFLWGVPKRYDLHGEYADTCQEALEKLEAWTLALERSIKWTPEVIAASLGVDL